MVLTYCRCTLPNGPLESLWHSVCLCVWQLRLEKDKEVNPVPTLIVAAHACDHRAL